MPRFTLKQATDKLKLIKTSAKRRGYEVGINSVHVYNVVNQRNCAYSGLPFDDDLTIERIDNNIGYVAGNIIPVKSLYNTIKSGYDINGIENRISQVKKRISDIDTMKIDKPVFNLSKNRKYVIEETIRAFKSKGCINADSDYKFDMDVIDQIVYNRLKGEIKRYSTRCSERDKRKAVLLSKLNDYNIVLSGLIKHSNVSELQQHCLDIGISIDSNIQEYNKHKLIYNELNNMIIGDD